MAQSLQALAPRSAAAADIEIEPVVSWRQRDEFVRLPWSIYRDDPCWVPPLVFERKDAIHPRKHPFYKHGFAGLFLARRAGRPVGRVMASDDPRYNDYHGSNLGCFGMFESEPDPLVAHALLDAAADWLRGRGRVAMRGPIDYSLNYECGLLVDGFDTPPRVMMNHQPRYYAGLFDSYGLAKVKDLFGWWFDGSEEPLTRWRLRAERMAQRSGVRVRPFRKRDMTAELLRCKHIYNQAWAKSFGFVPMTDAEFSYYGQLLSHIVPAEMLLIAEVHGEPVGFAMTLPDFNEILPPLDGRLTRWGLPVGAWKFWRSLKRIRTARVVTLGLLEPYRRRGIAELLILRTLDYGKHTMGFTGAELSWTLEDNDAINQMIQAVGGRRYKTYRLYEKTISAG